MRKRSRAVAAVVALLFCAQVTPSQPRDSAAEHTGSISGQVTEAGQPAPGIAVFVQETLRDRAPATQATTDEQGLERQPCQRAADSAARFAPRAR
jgi:hypothetical protein